MNAYQQMMDQARKANNFPNDASEGRKQEFEAAMFALVDQPILQRRQEARDNPPAAPDWRARYVVGWQRRSDERVGRMY